ncbi:MAG: dinitrogenase iron-molybdenum cofactor biosynthesis protein [Chloroflexi bacterium]|nr:dinitrogenase iron-molybdenum cofactor biosynthesis protein [Chloroflexota bacterium]
MILIISSQNADINSPVDPRFGRSQFFIKYDTNTNHWEAIKNSSVNQRGGAGIAAAQIAVNHKAEVVISGDFGPNAFNALKAAGITMMTFLQDTSTVQDTIDHYKQGKLNPFE